MTATSYPSSNLSQERPAPAKMDSFSEIEFLTADELAGRLKVKLSWVVEQTKRSRTHDPIPTVRFGKHNRYAWGSKALNAWIGRRFS